MNRSPEQNYNDELAVATHGLTVRYGNQTALDAVDLRIPEGSVYVLIGANGAGKSTTMKVLLNLERPTAGRAEVFGLDSALRGPAVRAQIGYVTESHEHDYRWMTIRQLIRHVAVHYPRWDSAYAERLIEAFAIAPSRKIGTLSRGEARRMQFMLALSHRPPLLLLDEPTDGFDPIVRSRALSQLAEHLADSPTTVVIATHHVSEIESLADHVGVLREGRVIAQMPRDELRRTVLRYSLSVPAVWEAPSGLRGTRLRRSRTGGEAQWTLIGQEREIVARLAGAGATVNDVTPLTLEEAAVALLSEEGNL